ncbi:site-2 protease family protein [Chlamydiia bacterium]|nr:site-2 protease family protein [Chlamydiia bacterium]
MFDSELKRQPQVRFLGASISWVEFCLYLGFAGYIILFQPQSIIPLGALIISIVCHEVAHGYAARYHGDTTAEELGRLTLNPLAHLDLVGSLLLPMLLIVTNVGFVFGWAKPVPVVANRLRNPNRNMVEVALAGPIINIVLMMIAFVLIYIITSFESLLYIFSTSILVGLVEFLVIFSAINLVLAAFNMLPIPPLDGSHLLYYFLPKEYRSGFNQFKPYGFFILIILLQLNVVSSYIGYILSHFSEIIKMILQA